MKAKYASYPYIVWVGLFILIPLGLIVYFAFTDSTGGFTLQNLMQASQYMPVLMDSIVLAAVSTALCLVIAYPVAYLISRKSGMTSRTLLILVMLPMWMNFLLRTYAWMTLLENNGLINQFFGLFGMGPFQLINTPGALSLIHI